MKTRLITIFSLVLSISWAVAATAADRPNVLVIAVDDLNDWVGCMNGHPQAMTPNIDRLAERGTLFTNAHCQAPICGPSRASLLSGRYPHETGIYQQPTKEIARDQQTASQLMPHYFSRHGYETFAGGKICHGFRHEQAFDHYAGGMGGSGPKPPNKARFHYRPPDTPWTGTQTDWGAFPDVDEEMPDHKVANWAVETLAQKHDDPFFLAVGFVRPHVPFYAPQKWFDPFPLDSVVLPEVRDDDMDDLPAIGRAINELPNYPSLAWLRQNDDEQFRRCVQAYLACIHFVDHQIGRVIDALDESPYAENTAIILFSDHGYHLGEKDRVSKHTLWEESTRVPLIIVRPKNAASRDDAHAVSRPVGLIDLFPTLIEMTGLPKRKQNSGASLVRLMEDSEAEWRATTITTYARGNHALRSDRYRYIAYPDGSEELYDHQSDPNEWVNLAGDAAHHETLASFRAQLPQQNAPYHPATSTAPINAWFKEHYQSEGVLP
jgi:arylsulfatase A-like enzyme